MKLEKENLDSVIDKMYKTHEGFEHTFSKNHFKTASINFQDTVKKNIEEANHILASKQDKS